MKVLVLGSGAREHAIAWKLSGSGRTQRVFVGPGNAGTASIADNLPSVNPAAFDSIEEAVRAQGIDCVFVGPEAPLAAGVVDFLSSKGIPAVGPRRDSAQLESSKAFSKTFLAAHRIPTAAAVEFRDPDAFERHIRVNQGKRLVVKKSGLASGKGVLESVDAEELVSFGRAALDGDRVLVEEFLHGWEVSLFGLSDGKSHIVLPPCTDFKKAHDGDSGPNTGGMGSVCPVTWVDDALMGRIRSEIVEPTYAAMDEEGLGYAGVLYFGLMITEQGTKVLEFNVRFGDPEAQVLLPAMDADFGELVEAMATGTLAERFGGIPHNFIPAESAALGVVIASEGYPESPVTGVPVEIAAAKDADGVLIFHASTSFDASGRILTGGGRCFTVVGIGKDLKEASDRAYAAAPKVKFAGGWFRTDIGRKLMRCRS